VCLTTNISDFDIGIERRRASSSEGDKQLGMHFQLQYNDSVS